MDLMWFIYLANLVDKILVFSCLFFIIFFIIGVIFSIVDILNDSKEYKKFSLTYLCLSILMVLIVIMTPNSHTLYIMLGVKKGQELFKEYKGNEILDKSSKLILKKLDEMLQEKE